jgi:hypothetical protein
LTADTREAPSRSETSFLDPFLPGVPFLRPRLEGLAFKMADDAMSWRKGSCKDAIEDEEEDVEKDETIEEEDEEEAEAETEGKAAKSDDDEDER